MAHVIVPTAEEILGKKFPVLKYGFVRLVDYMGGDESVVQAARVSVGKGLTTPQRDRALIFYLMEHRHTSPFEMVEFKFHCKMPIFVARQWVRHRTASINEISGRYSKFKTEFFIPETAALRLQDRINRQSRSGQKVDLATAKKILSLMLEEQNLSAENYEAYLDYGLAKEISRINLPLSTFTEWYWKIDLHNFLHFCKLRRASDAQEEIRVYADQMYELAKLVVPICCEAWEEFVFYAVTFSRKEMEFLRASISDSAIHHNGIVLGEERQEDFLKKLHT